MKLCNTMQMDVIYEVNKCLTRNMCLTLSFIWKFIGISYVIEVKQYIAIMRSLLNYAKIMQIA